MTTRAPRTRTAPVAEEPQTGILEITTSKERPVEEAREPLFIIDGEEFTVPKVINERLVFLAMNSIRQEGAVFAAMSLMELLLGKPQYVRLLELYERQAITQDNFDQIVKLTNGLFFKHMESDQEAAGKASPSS
ncbi:hypothetical protein [Streptomyces sp. NEAU-174]|uniref:hypothetical protein n=1 Tax=Streptomyces sp. NEAU-174 TaxID=3458254 RepID=UPI004044B22D